MQEDIAGIGRHQGRHGKYATFYVKRKMSEDFRSKPLVRMKCPVPSPTVLHYIFASWKNIVASGNAIHARSNTEIPSQVEQKDVISACQKKRPVPMPRHAPRGKAMNPTAACIVAAARAKPAEM